MARCSSNPPRRRWILLTTILASSTAFLMGTAVSVALPTIQVYFGAGITGIQWIVNAQLLFLSALLLVGGSLGDRLGRRKVFIWGMLIFAAASILSGFSGSLVLLIGFQALQGIGAALMIPQSLSIINVCFPERQRGRAIGLWAGFSGGIAALGPLLGGWLVETVNWRAVFFMPIPILLFSATIARIFVPESRMAGARRLDWLGALLIFCGLMGIAYGLIGGPVEGWTEPLILAGLFGGTAMLALFILVELRQPEPLLPLRIFKDPLVAGANMVTLLLYFALNGVIFFGVLNLQQVQGYSPTVVGLGMLPPIVLITALSGAAGALADRIGPRFQMTLGPTVVSVGIALLALAGTDASYLRHFLPGLSLVGGGMALVIAPLTKSALSVEPQFSGSASGVNNAVSRVAALLAVAVLGAIVVSTFTASLEESISVSSLAPEQKEMILRQADRLGAIRIPDTFDQETRRVATDTVRKSFVYGFRWAMAVSAGLALSSAVVSFFTIHRPASRAG